MQEYELSIHLMADILTEMREKYPRLANSFHATNVMNYMQYQPKMLNPARWEKYKKINYTCLNKDLKKFNHRLFIKWLLTKH